MPISIAAANIALGFGLLLACRRALYPLFAKSSSSFPSASASYLLFAFLAAYLVLDFSAIFLSGYPQHIDKWLEDKWVLSALIVPLALVRDRRIGERSLYLMMVGGLGAAALAIMQNAVGWDPLRGQFLEYHSSGFMALGTFNHHLTYGGAALVAALLALARFPFGSRRIDILRAVFCIVLSAVGLYVSFARSALVGYAFGALTLVFLAPPRWRWKALGVLTAGGLLLLLIVPGMAIRLLYIFQGGSAGEGPRLLLWKSAFNIVKHNLWFGVGQSNWGEAFLTYGAPGRYLSIAHPHCDLLSVAVDGGILTLLAFIALWGYIIYTMGHFFRDQYEVITRCQPSAGDSENHRAGSQLPRVDCGSDIVLKSGLSVVIGILFAGLFQNYQTDAEVANMFWFTVGTAFAVMNIIKRRAAASA